MSREISNPTGWLGAMAQRWGISQFSKWLMQEQVVPVAIVDTFATISAVVASPLNGVPSSAGELVAPAINTRLADTGQLAVGNWSIFVLSYSPDNIPYRLKRRNAADAADVWSFRFGGSAIASTGGVIQLAGRFSVATLERFVVENAVGGTAGVVYQASIFAVATP